MFYMQDNNKEPQGYEAYSVVYAIETWPKFASARTVACNRNANPEPAYFVHHYCNAVEALSLDVYCVPVTCTYSEK